jgi:hypothetical protein
MISTKPVLANAPFSIRDNLDPDSNVTEENDRQSVKHISPNIFTDEGRIISTKPVPPNVSFSFGDNLDPDSNLTEENDLHS